jgi:hypothetical protein
VHSCRDAVIDTLDQPRKRIGAVLEDHVVLQDVVKVNVQTAMPIENGDRPTEVRLRPELRFSGMRGGLHGAALDGGPGGTPPLSRKS